MSVYHRLYVEKVKKDPSLSNELNDFMDRDGGTDMPNIVQRFILDRPNTAYFMQVNLCPLMAIPSVADAFSESAIEYNTVETGYRVTCL